MLFTDIQRFGRSAPAVSSAPAMAAALARLREQTLPQLVTPPPFMRRAVDRSPRARTLSWLVHQLTRRPLVLAMLAAAVVTVATALPAWAALRDGGDSVGFDAARTSITTTGTAETSVADLGVRTFVGGLPFVQQVRYLDALAGSPPETARFVQGAREASLAGYLDDVGNRVALPYLSDAVGLKKAVEAWTTAVAAQEQRAASVTTSYQPVWNGAPITPGTRLPGATITFYACIGNGFCGNMSNGQPAFEGAAACSVNLPYGTRFRIDGDPTGRTFVCLDRGALTPSWVDVWFYSAADGWAWQRLVGNRGDVVIVE